jgi:hypothetical protein
MRRVVSTLLLTFSALAAWPAHATVVFNTFGSGDTFDSSHRYAVDGDLEFQAFRFSPSSSGILDTITVALARDSAATRETEFDLYDGTSSALGALLESFQVSNTIDLPGGVVSFSSVDQPMLTQSSFYWLSITEPDTGNGSHSLWLFNDQSIGTIRLTQNSQTPGLAPAFSVTVLVPEPATWALIVIAAVGVLGARFHRRFVARA